MRTYADNENVELPLEHCAEYDGAAEYFAKHNRLPECMGSPGAIDCIQADPEAFKDRVKLFKYAQSMGIKHLHDLTEPQRFLRNRKPNTPNQNEYENNY